MEKDVYVALNSPYPNPITRVIISPLQSLFVSQIVQKYSRVFVLWRRSGRATKEGYYILGNTIDFQCDFIEKLR